MMYAHNEKEKINEVKKEKQDLILKLKDVLKDDVSDVVISERLSDSPVCLVSGEGLSLEMEKVLASNPVGENAKANKILEINPNHELFQAIEKVYEYKNEYQDSSKKGLRLFFSKKVDTENVINIKKFVNKKESFFSTLFPLPYFLCNAKV